MAQQNLIGRVHLINIIVRQRQVLKLISPSDLQSFFLLDTIYVNLKRLYDQHDDQDEIGGIEHKQDNNALSLTVHNVLEDHGALRLLVPGPLYNAVQKIIRVAHDQFFGVPVAIVKHHAPGPVHHLLGA